MTPLFFSIVLPIYNAVNYIEKTLNCIHNQSFKNYELLIVDDGASDGTEDIVKRYSNENANTMYIKQNNQGISNARNTAIQNAKGKYLVFCDHDDIMDSNCLKKLFTILSQENFDVVKYSYKNQVIMNDKLVKQYDLICDDICGTGKDLQQNYNQFNNFIYTVWNGAYRTALIHESKLKFDESIKSGMEDVVFNLKLLQKNISICMISDTLYLHYIRYGQSASRKFDINKLDSILMSFDLEKQFFETINSRPNSDFYLLQMNKYIRSFFVAIGTKYNSLSDSSVKMRLVEFRKKMNYRFSIAAGSRYLIQYPKEYIKIVLFRLYLYKALVYLLRGQ